jgi:hypothetical protein
MPEKETLRRAKKNLREGKAPSTAAGEFIREEIHHVREGKHGVSSSKQAIAIGLAKARRAGVPLKPQPTDAMTEETQRSMQQAYEAGQGKRKPRTRSAKRSRATTRALRRKPKTGASHTALARQAKSAARRRRKRTSKRVSR